MNRDKLLGNPDLGIPGSKRDIEAAWAWLAPPLSPCFRCCLVLNSATHYTRKFGRCPILNKIHHEVKKEHEDLVHPNNA